jgi:hypothetical protein
MLSCFFVDGLFTDGALAKSDALFDPDYATAPSYRYANLDAQSCRAELDRRAIVHTPVPEAPGVLAPVRLPVGLRGVVFHTLLPREQRASSPWEVFDCRLVLALHDFAAILEAHQIDEVLIYSAWRPPPDSWPKEKLARRHPGGLAVDVFRFRKRPSADGPLEDRWLDVKDEWGGVIGAKTCGTDADPPSVEHEGTRELRTIVCEAAGARIFSTMLTPHYDEAHFNHVHLEVTPEVRWRIVR